MDDGVIGGGLQVCDREQAFQHVEQNSEHCRAMGLSRHKPI